MDFFESISRYMMNPQLIIDLLVVLKLLNMINGSDHDYKTRKMGFQRQNRYLYVSVKALFIQLSSSTRNYRIGQGEVQFA